MGELNIMAKRPDRNRQAILKRQADESPDTWTTNDGRVIQLKKPDLMFIQQASASVDFPDPPTYEVKIGNRVREYPLDDLVIKQTEDPVERLRLRKAWNKYQEDYGRALNDLTVRSTGAVFYEGTVAQLDLDDPKWEKKMKMVRWPIPTDPEERWIFYLQTSLDEDEIGRLSAKIVMFAGGVSEEKVAAAEEMFPGIVPTDRQPGNVEDSEADEGGDRGE